MGSVAESVQLKQELKILNDKIDRVEAEAACHELTTIERSIRQLESSASQTGDSPHSPEL